MYVLDLLRDDGDAVGTAQQDASQDADHGAKRCPNVVDHLGKVGQGGNENSQHISQHTDTVEETE